jgi:hypothetical protein
MPPNCVTVAKFMGNPAHTSIPAIAIEAADGGLGIRAYESCATGSMPLPLYAAGVHPPPPIIPS